MKKIFVLAIGLLFGIAAFAQNENGEAQPYKVYCELIARPRSFSTKVDVELDFGQANNFWSGDRRLFDEDGKAIVFNSMLDAANYMARRGWELETAFPTFEISSGSSISHATHWVMFKFVTDDSQITENLVTGDMLKKK